MLKFRMQSFTNSWITLIGTLLCFLFNLCEPAAAVNEYWDPDANVVNNNVSTGAGLGGATAGNWVGSAVWYNGTSDVAWSDGGDAIFWGSAGGSINQFNSTVSVNSLSFKASGYVVNGNVASLLNLAGPSITADTGVSATLATTVSGSAGLTKNGNGSLHLAVANSYAGGTTINGGTLGIVSGALGALPLSPAVDVTINNGATLRFNANGLNLNANHQILLGTGGGAINSFGNNVGILGVISGSSLSKTGSGTLTLSNANTYTGGTTISGGSLMVTNGSGSATGTGLVTVNAAAILAGNGTVQGNVVNNGIVVPNNFITSAGTILHVGGDYTQSSSASLNVSIDFSPGLAHDKLAIVGNASLAGTLNVTNLIGATPHVGDTFEILSAFGLGGTKFTNVSLPQLTGGLALSVNYGATAVSLSVGLAGDFNGDGVVDAADYTLWRHRLGSTTTQADYDTWRSRFGQIAAAGSGLELTSAVPEPGTLVAVANLTMLVVLPMRFATKRRRPSL